MKRPRYEVVGPANIAQTATICSGAVVGKNFRPLIGFESSDDTGPTVVRDRAYVGHYVLVGTGADIGEGAVIDDFSVLEPGVQIGSTTLLIYRAQVCCEARVGAECVIGGFVGERVIVEDRCRIFGNVVHSHRDLTRPWDDPAAEEPSAIIRTGVFVGFGATIAGAVEIGEGAYVCAHALVTKRVPARHIAYGVNMIVAPSEWKGDLAGSPQFADPANRHA